MYCLAVCYEFVSMLYASPMLRVFGLVLCNDFFTILLTFLKLEERVVLAP